MTRKVEIEIDPHPRGWVLVRALMKLGGGGGTVEAGEEYLQPPESAQFMVAQGWCELVVDADIDVEKTETIDECPE